MSLEKRKTLMKTFIETQFNYCPLLSMLHSERLNNKSKSGFQNCQKNIQSLAIEIYKYLHGLFPTI